MRLGLISDVHCNSAAFTRALAELDEPQDGVDDVLLLGDLVYEYRFCGTTVGLARQSGFRYVLGNHEMGVLQGVADGRVRGADPEQLAYLQSRPTRLDLLIEGKRICVVHASPFAPFDEYLYGGSPQLRRCGELEVDMLFLGHTHVPMAERYQGTLVVNPGSLGESRDPRSPQVSYAIVDTDSESVELRRFPNPTHEATGPTTSSVMTPRAPNGR